MGDKKGLKTKIRYSFVLKYPNAFTSFWFQMVISVLLVKLTHTHLNVTRSPNKLFCKKSQTEKSLL